MTDARLLVMIITIAAVTALLRFLPFVLMGKGETPPFLEYLGKVLPYSVMAMLVIYCLKDIDFNSAPFGLCEIVSVIAVIALHAWKRNTLLSIIAGTACYMILIRL